MATDSARKNFIESFSAFFGYTPKVSRTSSGAYTVGLRDGDSVVYDQIELRMMAGFYREMKEG